MCLEPSTPYNALFEANKRDEGLYYGYPPFSCLYTIIDEEQA